MIIVFPPFLAFQYKSTVSCCCHSEIGISIDVGMGCTFYHPVWAEGDYRTDPPLSVRASVQANKLVPRGLVFGCLWCILNGIYSVDT